LGGTVPFHIKNILSPAFCRHPLFRWGEWNTNKYQVVRTPANQSAESASRIRPASLCPARDEGRERAGDPEHGRACNASYPDQKCLVS
jgi:hypothetical protein